MNQHLTISKQTVLKPYKARPFKQYELATVEDMVNGAGGTLIIDTENYPNYFLIAFKNVKTKKVFKLEIRKDHHPYCATNLQGMAYGPCDCPFKFDPAGLFWILYRYKTVGFNSLKYDLPLIWLSYHTQNLTTLKNASNWLVREHYHKQTFEHEYNIKLFDTAHIDLIEVCPLRGSLKLYGGRLHAQRIQDVPFDPNSELTTEQIEIVSDYCVNDLDITELAYNELKEPLELREQLSQEYNCNLMSKSDAQIAESVIGNELKKITGKWPKKPTIDTSYSHKFIVPENIKFQTPALNKVLDQIQDIQFTVLENGRIDKNNPIKDIKVQIGNSIYRMGIGGLHSSEENVSYVSNEEYTIFDRDVGSYYPAIVLNGALYPKHLGENFTTVYRSIVNRRLEAKKAKNLAVSECLKICINGTFGKTGSPHSFLYAPEMTVQITVCGQLYLLMLIEALELRSIQVISANTDGILIYCRRNEIVQMETVIKCWEIITEFTTEETKYKAYYARDVNAYLAIKENDEIKGKNVYYDPWRGEGAKDKYWTFQKNPKAQICIEAVTNLLLHGKEIADTIKECQDIRKFVCVQNVKGGAHKDGEYLGKVVRWYYGKNEYGTINYIISGNKVPDTEGAIPCLDLPAEVPANIDYDWYIRRTNELLTDMNWLKKPKQLKFF